jgi:signal transduction histidine kinase/GAF domain-containing protein
MMDQDPPYWTEGYLFRWDEGRILAEMLASFDERTSMSSAAALDDAPVFRGALADVATEAIRHLTAIFNAQVERVARLMDAPCCALYLAEPARASDTSIQPGRRRQGRQTGRLFNVPPGVVLSLRALYGASWSQASTRLGMPAPPGGPAMQAFVDQAPLLSDAADVPALNEWARERNVRRWLYVPIVGLSSLWSGQQDTEQRFSGAFAPKIGSLAEQSEAALGVLAVGRFAPAPDFTMAETRLLSVLGEELALAIENARLAEQVRVGRTLGQRYREVLAGAVERERIIEELGEGVLALHASGQITHLNVTGRELLGWSGIIDPSGALGHVQDYEPIQMRTAQGDLLLIEDWPMFQALRGVAFTNMEVRYLGPDGQERLLVFSGRPLLDTQGRLECALLNFHEASVGQIARAELEQMVRLADQRAHYVGSVLEAMTDSILVCNSSGALLLVNPAGKRMLGMEGMRFAPGEYHLSQFIADFQVRAPNGQPLTVEDFPLMQALRGKMVRDVEMILRQPGTDEDLQVHVSASPVKERMPGAPVVGAVAVLVDVTTARALDRAKDEFLAISAHELKGPLTSIRGFAQLLRRGTKQAPHGIERRTDMQWVEKIETQSERLGRLIEELADAARADLGKFDLRLRLVPLGALLRRVAEAQQVTAERHKIVVDAPATGLFVRGDETRLEQVFGNLIANAIKYSPAGGEIAITTTITSVQEHQSSASFVEVSIQDQGQGIAPRDLERIFTRFTRAENRRGVQGLGLGLYIARAIVEEHGGTIHAESKGPGQGSTFIVRLPREEPA